MNELIDTFSNRLNKAINLRNIKPSELSEKTGIDKSKISSYMSGRYKAKQDGIYLLANALNVSEAWLMGLDVSMEKKQSNKISINKNKSIRIPVLGSIPAGIPMEMIEDIVDWEDISEEMLKGGKQYFALKIKGDSMFPEYLNGDTIIVLKQDNCENGQDCVVAVNGDDATFKRVFKTDNGITLQPLNNSYMPMFYSNDDVLNKPVKILGVVKQIRRNK